MAFRHARYGGKIKIRGRPREVAAAEVMIMKQQEAYEARKRRRNFFTLLDIIAILALICSIYSFYSGKILNGFLSLLVSVLILGYFLSRNSLRKRK